MNVPKTIQEILFLQVAKSQTGKGIEELWQGEQTASQQFDAKGIFVERGLLEFTDQNLLVPFVRHTQFGKPRRAKVGAAARKVSSAS